MTTDTSKTKDPAKAFVEMAARIERNRAEFAGAFVIVSPTGEIISAAMFDPVADEPTFWGTVDSRVKAAAQESLDKLAETMKGTNWQRPR